MCVIYLESSVFASISLGYLCMYVRACMHACMHVCMYICIYIYIYIYISVGCNGGEAGQRHECICMSLILIFLQLLMITTSTDVSY